MKPSKKPVDDGSAEEKIKEAARKLFTQNGFSATKTRDIASEAGINLALLNYYFRSKEKLFEIIMMENMQQFIKGIGVIANDETASLDKKVERIVAGYIDMLVIHPDLPFFTLNEIRHHPEKWAEKMKMKEHILKSHFMMQLQQAAKSAKSGPVNPIHFLANILSLTIFPFIARPMLQAVNKLDQKQFNAMMQERKKLIPVWVKALIRAT